MLLELTYRAVEPVRRRLAVACVTGSLLQLALLLFASTRRVPVEMRRLHGPRRRQRQHAGRPRDCCCGPARRVARRRRRRRREARQLGVVGRDEAVVGRRRVGGGGAAIRPASGGREPALQLTHPTDAAS